jgi:hypothetical protein
MIVGRHEEEQKSSRGQGMRLSIDRISGADELIVLGEKSYRHGK